MFTGIVEELGSVRALVRREGGARIEIDARRVLEDATIGASIAVNGCCLTAVRLGDGWWAADAVVETLDRTTLGTLREGDGVNLERPVRVSDRLGGHVVQGHVDGVARIDARTMLPDGSVGFRVATPVGLTRYVVEKGSVAVDGVSLTVTGVDADGFAVAVIPHTLAVTTFGARGAGDAVNVEVDLLAKHVERLISERT